MRLRLFGGFNLEDAWGEPVPLNLRKAEALLAYLATSPGQAFPREALACLLWGEFDEQRARQSLRQTLLSLSKGLGKREASLLCLENQRVSLNPGAVVVDAVEFERLMTAATYQSLTSATALYTGEFLSGLSINSPGFEDWLTVTRSRYQELAMRSLVNLLRLQRNAGEIDLAIGTANRALRFDLYREDVHRQLMELYLTKGMRSSALTQFKVCREMLRRELGVGPDGETTRLYNIILDQRMTDGGKPPSYEDTSSSQPITSASDGKGPDDGRTGAGEPLSRLSELGQRLITAASVLGPQSSYEVLRRMADLEEHDAVSALEELVGAQLMVVDQGNVEFASKRICRDVYKSLLQPRRKLLHAAAAQAIADVHWSTLETQFQNIAYHHSKAGNLRQAFEFHVKSAEFELSRGATLSARAYFERALRIAGELEPDCAARSWEVRARLGLGRVAEIEGDLETALECFKAAESLAERTGDVKMLGISLIGRMRIHRAEGSLNMAYACGRRGLSEAKRAISEDPWLPTERLIARIHLLNGDYGALEDRLARHKARCARLGLKLEEIEATRTLGLASAIRGNFLQAYAYLDSASQIAESVPVEAELTACLQMRAMTESWNGELDKALANFARATKQAHACGDVLRLYSLRGHHGYALLLAENCDEAAAQLRRAATMAEKLGTRFLLPFIKSWLAEALLELGRDSQARRVGQNALSLSMDSNQAWAASVATRVLARVLSQGKDRNLKAAERAIRWATETQRGLGLKVELARSLIVEAKILRAGGELGRSHKAFRQAGEMFQAMDMTRDFDRASTLADALQPREGPRH